MAISGPGWTVCLIHASIFPTWTRSGSQKNFCTGCPIKLCFHAESPWFGPNLGWNALPDLGTVLEVKNPTAWVEIWSQSDRVFHPWSRVPRSGPGQGHSKIFVWETVFGPFVHQTLPRSGVVFYLELGKVCLNLISATTKFLHEVSYIDINPCRNFTVALAGPRPGILF